MTFESLKNVVSEHPEKRIAFQLPDGKLVPLHFHITELGVVTKEFVDCGGEARSSKSCVLQLWVANDTDHSLTAAKFGKILNLGDKLGIDPSETVECEYQAGHLSLFQLADFTVNEKAIIFQLTDKHTDCLSKDACGLTPDGFSMCC